VDDDPSNEETQAAPTDGGPAAPVGSPDQPGSPPSPPAAPLDAQAPVVPTETGAPTDSQSPVAPPGWWQTPDGRWQPPPPGRQRPPAGQVQEYRQQAPGGPPSPSWQPPSDQGGPYPHQAWGGRGRASDQPPWSTAPLPYGAPPYGAPAEPAPRPAGGAVVFGVTPGARPGQVPWRGRDVLFAALIAGAPLAALTLLGTVASKGANTTQQPTVGFALAAVISTVVVDCWLVFWAWFFSLRKYHLGFASFGFRGYEERSSWGVAAALILGGLFATNILGSLNDYVYRKIVGPVPQENVVTIFPHTSAGFVLFLVFAALIVPVLEETIFRGFVFQGLARSWGPLLGAIVSSLLFAAWHQQLSVLIPIFGLALLLSAGFYWTKSIYTNIAFHGFFNATATLIWWFVHTKG